ncbi:MAG: MATE family efflux transporter, partial [Clostridia bacterium]|nr:MATE family efflux transporter [Clostridia bacterium]
PDRVRSGVRSACVLSIITSVIISSVMLVFGRSVVMLFIASDNAAVAMQAGDTAYVYLSVMAVCLPVLYLLYVFLSALQGMGNAMVPMVSGFLELAIRVAIAGFVVLSGYSYGIFGAEVGAWIGSAVFLMISYFRSIKKLNAAKTAE